MESVEKIPKNFAAIMETGPVEEFQQEFQQRRARSHSAGVAKPTTVRLVANVETAAIPEQVGLGGRDGNFLSCLRVPGVSGFLIAC